MPGCLFEFHAMVLRENRRLMASRKGGDGSYFLSRPEFLPSCLFQFVHQSSSPVSFGLLESIIQASYIGFFFLGFAVMMPPRASMEGSLAKRFRSKGNTTLSTPRKGNQLPVSPSSTRHNEEPDIAAPFRQKLDEAWGKDRWGPPASYRPPKDPPLSPRGICLTFSTEDLARLHEITILAQQHQTPLKDLYEKGGLLYLAALKDGSPRWSPGLPGRALQMFREHVIDLTPSSQPPPENPCSESIEEKAFVQLRKRSPLTGDVVSHLGRRCPTGTPSNVEILDPSFFQSPSLSHRKQLNKDLTYCVANDESYFTLLCMRLDRQSNTIFIGHYDPTKDFPRYNSFMNRVRNWIGKACHGWCYKFEFIVSHQRISN